MKILIGYNGTAAAALRDLQKAGLPAEAEALVLVALQAVPPEDAFALDSTGSGWLANAYLQIGPTSEQIKEALDGGESAARTLKAHFPAWTVKVETAASAPARALLEKADAWKADLIVVGSHGWTWLGRTLIGSTAQSVLTHARANVRLANPRPENADAGMSPRLLLAMDGSDNARFVFEEIRRRNWPWAPMEKYLEAAVSLLKKSGLSAEWEIREGDSRSVILSSAESFRADCIFMGRRGVSGFKRLLLGSVSAAVAAHAACSVEVIRSPVKARALGPGARRAIAERRSDRLS